MSLSQIHRKAFPMYFMRGPFSSNFDFFQRNLLQHNRVQIYFERNIDLIDFEELNSACQ